MRTSQLSIRTAALLLAACATACVPEDGPLMKPGSDCLRCHGDGGGEDGPPWTLAGTVYASPSDSGKGIRGAAIEITAADGRTVTLHSNEVGNFYLADGLAFPLQVAVEAAGVRHVMTTPVASGSCNRCHHAGSTEPGVPGSISAR